MTDKVQKIREEVERLMAELIQEKGKGYGSDVDDACILELQNVLTFIDSLQEEPVAPKVLKNMFNAKTAAESLGILQEEHDRIVDELIYGKEPELVDSDDLPKEEPVSEGLEEAAIMHYKDVMEYEAKTGLKPAYMTSFKTGAQWQQEKTISKACEWIGGFLETSPLIEYQVMPENKKAIIDDFRKAMEE